MLVSKSAHTRRKQNFIAVGWREKKKEEKQQNPLASNVTEHASLSRVGRESGDLRGLLELRYHPPEKPPNFKFLRVRYATETAVVSV